LRVLVSVFWHVGRRDAFDFEGWVDVVVISLELPLRFARHLSYEPLDVP
jgi:hypothetical protein